MKLKTTGARRRSASLDAEEEEEADDSSSSSSRQVDFKKINANFGVVMYLI